MNVELAYIKTEKLSDIISIVKGRIINNNDFAEVEIDIGLPSSYKTLLKNERNRKIAISECTDGWISLIESKEVNDYKLLIDISLILKTDVLAIVISDVTGACGFVEFSKGRIVNKYFSDSDNDIEKKIDEKKEEKKIKNPIYMFREIVNLKNWIIIGK